MIGRALLAVATCAVLAACAGRSPDTVELDFEARAERLLLDDVIVDVAVLGRDEARREFGVDLAAVGVQPVWIRIVNARTKPVWLAPLAIDPDYWSPMEAAYRVAADTETALAIRETLVERAAPVMIDGQADGQGFIYTHPDEGLKPVRIHLIGFDWDAVATTVLRVPGSIRSRDLDLREPDPRLPEIGLAQIQAWAEAQDCCTRNRDGLNGDPLNIVLVGSGEEVVGALVDTHWDIAFDDDAGSRGRLIRAFLSGDRERYAPVSPLFLFGRRADLAFQKARDTVDQRNHLRLWRAPVLMNGREVWLGQISRDVGVKVTFRHWPPVTHVIDPAVDDARFYLMQDLLLHEHVATVGFAGGATRAGPDAMAENAEGDPYFSDGLRVILVLAREPVPPAETVLLPGELPGRIGERLQLGPR